MNEPVSLTAAARQLVVAPDGDEYVLGRPDRGVFVVVPKPGAVFIEALQAGAPLAEAAARASAMAGEPVDTDDFIAGLTEAGMLDPPEEAPPVRPPVSRAGRRTREIRWIEGVSPAAARRLFGPVAWGCYALAAGFAVVVLLVRPDLRPTFEHAWWLPDPVLSILVFLPIGLLLAACHEAWHWLAGRALGVPAIFRVSYRGIFLVFETDLSQLVTMPRRRRYGPFLAGMAFDLSVLAIALGLRLGNRVGWLALPGLLDRLLAVVVLVQVLRVAWQWAGLVMRSDGYAVIANALRCHDLYRATWLTTKDRMWRLTSADREEYEAMSGHDRRVAGWFGLPFLAGIFGMGWLLVHYTAPFLIGTVTFVGQSLLRPSLGSVEFWQSAAVVAVLFGQYAAVPLLAWRERRLRRAGVLR